MTWNFSPKRKRPLTTVPPWLKRLVNKADSAGLQPEDLDEMVHDLVSGIAADINNEGVDGQIKYLVKEMGAQDTERQIDKLIEER